MKVQLTCNVVAMLLLCAGAFAQGSLTIANHSFETDPVTAFPTYRTTITGWTMSGGTGFGVNTTTGPFMDNGVVPDGAKVLFMQNQVAASQSVAGFDAGTTYTVRLRVNSRASTANALLQVSVGGTVIVPPTSVAPVGGSNAFVLISADYAPPSSGAFNVKIENTNGGGDNSLLVDQVEIAPRVTSASDWQHLE